MVHLIKKDEQNINWLALCQIFRKWLFLGYYQNPNTYDRKEILVVLANVLELIISGRFKSKDTDFRMSKSICTSWCTNMLDVTASYMYGPLILLRFFGIFIHNWWALMSEVFHLHQNFTDCVLPECVWKNLTFVIIYSYVSLASFTNYLFWLSKWKKDGFSVN